LSSGALGTDPRLEEPGGSQPDPLEYEPVSALVPLLQAVWSRRWLVLAIAAVTVGACALWLTQRSLTYEASAQILVTPLVEGEDSLVGLPIVRTSPGDPTRTVETAARVVTSPAIASATASEVGGITGPDVTRAVTIEPQEGTNVIEVTAETDDPERSAEIANAYVQSALAVRQSELKPAVQDEITQVEDEIDALPNLDDAAALELKSKLSDLQSISDGTDPTLSIPQLAEAPTGPTQQSPKLLLLLAGIAGLMIGAGAAVALRSSRGQPVENDADLFDALPLPILARVPALRHRDRGSLLAAPEIRSSYRLLRDQLEVREQESGTVPMESGGPNGLIAVTGAHHGDGITTTALGLAAAATTAGRSVIAFELGRGKPMLAEMLGVRARGLVRHADGHGIEALLTPVPGVPNLKLIAADPSRETRDRLDPMARPMIAEARELADCVIVDAGPAGDTGGILGVLYEAEHVLVVARTGHTPIEGLSALSNILTHGSTLDRAGYVVIGGGRSMIGR